MNILLVAKPWRGGLGKYYHLALQDMFPGAVEWVQTRPSHPEDLRAYRRNPEQWWDRLRTRITSGAHDVALFIDYYPEWRGLPYDSRNILYAIDAVTMQEGDLDAFGQVYGSDPGYGAELEKILKPHQHRGILPFACYPPMHQPMVPNKKSMRDVVFIGSRDCKRDAFIAHLLRQPYCVSIIGNYFLKSGPFWQKPWVFRPTISNENMGEIYAQHAISLNIHASVVRGGTNMRSFESAAYGIPQVVEWREGIEDYFLPDEEITLFRTPEEMVEAIDSVLKSETAYRQERALRARQRVLGDHTYYHRIVTLLGRHVPADQLQSAFEKARVRYVIP